MKNVKENATMTANEVANVNGNTKSNRKNGLKRKPIPAVWRVVNKARFTFDTQLTKNNEVKLASIAHHITSEFKDVDKFWVDFMEEVNKLVDSKKYEWECGVLGMDSQVIATHIVFLGSAVVNKVLKHGIREALGTDYKLYKDSFIPADAQKYLVDFSRISDSEGELETGVLSQIELDESDEDNK